ncbi:MAG: hypothetical protein ACRD5H_01230, partial [Nitrososphaerales archaeon]
ASPAVLEHSAARMGLLDESNLIASAKYNRRSLIQAIRQKRQQLGKAVGPAGSAAANDMPSGYSVPQGTKRLLGDPRRFEAPQLAKIQLTAPIHIGGYRMTPTGEFKPLRSKLFGLSPKRSFIETASQQQQALVEAKTDQEEEVPQPISLQPPVKKIVETLAPKTLIQLHIATPIQPPIIAPLAIVPPVVTPATPAIPPPPIEPIESPDFGGRE